MSECRLFRDSFSALTRIARKPLTGHSCSQMPQPVHSAGSMKGFCRRTSMEILSPAAGTAVHCPASFTSWPEFSVI